MHADRDVILARAYQIGTIDAGRDVITVETYDTPNVTAGRDIGRIAAGNNITGNISAGGEIGKVVGEKMAEIARGHQVLCVTHLPQVAAQGSSHFVVTKDQSKDRAVVAITPIQENRKQRVSELARMLGDRTAKSALAHAEELLAR